MHLPADIRYALRSLRKAPGFSLAVIVTLAVGVGTAAAMYSVLHGVVLRPLPVADEDQLLLIHKELRNDDSTVPFPFPDFEALRDSTRTLASLAGVQYDGAWPYPIQEGDQVSQIRVALVSSELFATLGIRPAAGRIFNPADGEPGADGAVVISHALWKRRYGADPATIGRVFNIVGSDDPITIVGVAPEGFAFPQRVEMWMVLPSSPDFAESRFAPFSLVGRARRGTTAAQIRAEAQNFLQEREATFFHAGEARGQRAVVTPLAEAVVGDVRPAILVLFLAGCLLLLLAGANVANLYLIRGAERGHELSLRSALGARRAQIMRQLLVESALHALLGALLGIAVTWVMIKALLILAPPDIPRVDSIGIDLGVLGFALAASLATTMLIGLSPILWILRSDLNALLRQGAVRSDPQPVRLGKQILVIWQVALAVAVLAGAGLLGRTLWSLQQQDMGFALEELSMVNISLPRSRYQTQDDHLNFFQRISERLVGMPGIAGATPVMTPPFSGEGGWNTFFLVEGQGAADATGNPTLNLEAIEPTYFDTLEVGIVQGRAFSAADDEDAVPVAIVSQALARRLWPEESPLGQRIKLGAADSSKPWRDIVGVANDLRFRDLAAPPPTVFIPLRQSTYFPRRLIVRATEEAFPMIRAASQEIDDEARVVEATTLPDLLAAPLARPRFMATLLGCFAAVSWVLAAVGLYGVMMTWVVQRSRELALRMAIGAERRDLHRMVLGKAFWMVSAGLVLGLVLAAFGGRALSTILFEVGPKDPVTLLMSMALLVLATLPACYQSMRHATAIDPAATLRGD